MTHEEQVQALKTRFAERAKAYAQKFGGKPDYRKSGLQKSLLLICESKEQKKVLFDFLVHDKNVQVEKITCAIRRVDRSRTQVVVA